MNIKSLFIKDDSPASEETAREPKVVAKPSFPEEKAAPTFPNNIPEATPYVPLAAQTSGKSYHAEVLEVYLTGLDGLNQEGVEFFELLKAVEAVDINNPAAYKMAIQMLQNVDKTFTKEKALSTSQHYIDNILLAHKDFYKEGLKEREKLQKNKSTEGDALNKDIETITSQIEALQADLVQKKSQLSNIDAKYTEPLAEVEGKLEANDMAKDTVIAKLNTVIQNLKNS